MFEGRGAETSDPKTCDGCRKGNCGLAHKGAETGRRRLFRLSKGERLQATDAAGGPCMTFWIIIDGSVANCTTFEDGRRQIIAIERTGDVVCGLISGPSTQSWLEALEDCEVLKLDLSEQALALRDDPRFLAATFAIVHRRLTRSQERISALGRLDSQERVLLFLAEAVIRHAAVDPVAPVTELSMSREDMADYLGLNAETVSRMLTRIRKSGLVKFLNRNEFIIPDMAAIRRRLPVDIVEPKESCNARMLMEACR